MDQQGSGFFDDLIYDASRSGADWDLSLWLITPANDAGASLNTFALFRSHQPQPFQFPIPNRNLMITLSGPVPSLPPIPTITLGPSVSGPVNIPPIPSSPIPDSPTPPCSTHALLPPPTGFDALPAWFEQVIQYLRQHTTIQDDHTQELDLSLAGLGQSDLGVQFDTDLPGLAIPRVLAL